MQKIIPFLWFDDNAEEAVKFYTSVFKNTKTGNIARYDEASAKVSGRPAGSVMTVAFALDGQQFTALNGGPMFKITPAISFFVNCKTAEEVDALWEKLKEGGIVRMELGKYPFSDRYGWIEDKFGVSWQVMLPQAPSRQKIIPSLLFVGKKFGKAEEAMKLYTSVFPDASVTFIQKAGPDATYGNPDAVQYASFTLFGEPFTVMDGPGKHPFDFNEGISLLVNCETQKEIDAYWNALTAGGGQEVQCGWLKDRFGVSWQIVPTVLEKMIQDKDKAKAKRAMEAMLQMKKIDMRKLQEACDG